MKKKIILILLIVLISGNISSYAESTPYASFIQLAGAGYFGESQNLYEPYDIFKEGIEKPEDIFYFKDKLYVADSGEKAIIVFDKNGNQIGKIGEGIFVEPTGVFVSEEYIYVADYGSSKVFKLSYDGEVLNQYERPTNPLYGKKETYKPIKVVADASGDIYIISEGSTNGIVQMTDQGEFLGYFGVNRTSVSFRMLLQRFMSNDEKRSQLLSLKPPSPINITIDQDGIVYTATNEAGESERVKKLNIAGDNVINAAFSPTDITSMSVDKDGNIYVISGNAEIWIYDSFGNLLGVLIVIDPSQERLGVFRQPSGICVDENYNIYIADKANGSINILQTTEIAELMFGGVNLYKEGHYVESMDIWKEVLTLNSNFSLAHKALGKAYFKQQDYETALEEFKLSADTKGYSEAFWEIRNDWLMTYLSYIFIGLLLFIILKKSLNYVDKKKKIYDPIRQVRDKFKLSRVYDELRISFYIIKHPIDACDYIKRLKKVSYIGWAVMMIWFIIGTLLTEYYKGFIFTGMINRGVNVIVEILLLVIPLFGFIIANYLVSTITDGEGTFKNVLISSTAAFSPLFLFSLPLSIVTNFLTINEAFVFSFGQFALIAWSFVNLFIVVKEIHNYSISETIKNVVLTIFGVIILLLVIFITYVLFDQVIKFVVNFR